MWWCARHKKFKAEHKHTDNGPCPLWYVPIGWWANFQCALNTCSYKGTCINCDGTDEIRRIYNAYVQK
jgi:hypothetical protein